MPNPSIKDLAYRGLAATLGGPVDLASMVMRPFGYSTPDAQVVGGSEWMGKKMEDMGIVSSARSPLQEFAASMTIPTPSGIGKGLAMAAPALIGATRGIGKVDDAFKNPIENVLQSMSRNIDDDSINAAFGANGYVYHTPLRPFENSQQSAIGVKATPLAERVFTTDTPLSAAQLRAIEAIPMSDNSTRAIAKEIADSGAFAFMHKDGKRFSVVMPSAKNDKTIQTTQYDTKGAIGDSQHGSNEDAIKELIYSGYTKILDPDRAEKMMERVMLK